MAPQQTTTQRYAARITTVDPAQGLVEAVTKDGSVVRVSVYQIPTAFRWPQVGEGWIIQQMNGSWYLESYYPASTDFKGVVAGDAVITSPTGKIVVMTNNVTPDFTIQQRTGLATFTGLTGGGGNVTLNHTLGVIPGSVIAMPHGWPGYMYSTGAILSATQVALEAITTGVFDASLTYHYFFYLNV